MPATPCPVTGSLRPPPLRRFVREDVFAIHLARRKIVGYRKNRTKVRGTQCATLTRGIVPQIGVMPDEPRATDFCALCSIFSVPASLGLCQRLAAPVTGCGAVRSRYNVERGRFAAWAAPPLRRSDHGCKHHQRDVQRFTGGNRNHRPFAGEEGMTTANRDLAKKKPGHPGK